MMVLLYSSDYYPVYKKDIFAVTSLPEGYCYHFRYQPKYVSQKIKDGESLTNCMAIIIFVHGNAKGNTNSNLTYVPVRLARIVKVHQDPQTDLYHVYFSLDSFIEVSDDISKFDETPPNIFFGTQVIQPRFNRTLWKEAVKKLNAYSNSFFFHIKVLKNLKEIRPLYEPDTYESSFELTEGKHYSLRISISDDNTNKDENEIVTKIEGADIKSNIGETIDSGLSLDGRSFRLSGLILGDLSSKVNLIKISTRSTLQAKTKDDYSVRLLFDVKKDPDRHLSYLWFSALILLGGGLITVDLTKVGLTEVQTIVAKLVGLPIGAVAAATLFYRFNKK